MKFIINLLLIMSIAFFSSCKRNIEQKTTVTFWHAMGGPLGKTLDSLITEFNKNHHSIKIEPVNMGNYQALSQKLMAAVTAKKPPTIAQVFESWTDQLLKTNAITPIDDLLSEEEKAQLRKDFYPVFIEDNTWGGKLVTLPFNKSVPAYFYNKTLLSKNGIERFPQTWNEFITVGKKLTQDTNGDGKSDIYATAFPMSTWMFETLLFQNGGRLLEDDNITPLFNNKAGIEALNLQIEIIKKYHIGYLTTGYQHQDDFLAGKVAFISGSTVSYSFIKSSSPDFQIGIAPVPYGKNKAVLISGTNIAIFSRTSETQKKAALSFIKWFLSPEIQAIWSYRTGYVPVRLSSLNSALLKKRMSELPGFKEVLAQLNFAYTEPRIAGWLAGRQILGTDGIEPALRGVKSPEQSLNDCAKKIERILKER